MLPERRRRVNSVWWSGLLDAERTSGGLQRERFTKRAVVFAPLATYRVGPYTSIESLQSVQTSATHPSKEGKCNERGGVSFEPIRYLSKVRWARNEGSEFKKYSTNLLGGGRGVSEGKRTVTVVEDTTTPSCRVRADRAINKLQVTDSIRLRAKKSKPGSARTSGSGLLSTP